MRCYSNNGFSMRAVQTDYQPVEGEVLFETEPAEAALIAAFPARAAQLLAEAKELTLAAIDRRAGGERAKYITVAPGQDMTYQEKVRQAQAFQADQAPSAASYPMIYGEVGITADDPAGVATAVLQSFALWQQIGTAIERVRLQAKKQVAEAADLTAIDAVINGLQWPQPSA